jgi:hypothetical protein
VTLPVRPLAYPVARHHPRLPSAVQSGHRRGSSTLTLLMMPSCQIDKMGLPWLVEPGAAGRYPGAAGCVNIPPREVATGSGLPTFVLQKLTPVSELRLYDRAANLRFPKVDTCTRPKWAKKSGCH